MTDEMRTIQLYEELTRKGYRVKRDASDRWMVAEPQNRNVAQNRVAIRTMAEVAAWAEGVEDIRNAFGV